MLYILFTYTYFKQNMKTKWAVKKNNPQNTQEIHQPALMFNALHLKSSMLIVGVHERLLNIGGGGGGGQY